jgi:hypothetical protein
VLEGGEIVERGTHDELLALNGRYRQLYDKQYTSRTIASSIRRGLHARARRSPRLDPPRRGRGIEKKERHTITPPWTRRSGSRRDFTWRSAASVSAASLVTSQ